MALGTLAVVFAYFFRKSMLERVIDRALRDPDRDPRQRLPRGADGLSDAQPRRARGAGRDPPDGGLFTFGLAFALLLVEASLLQVLFRRYRRARPPTGGSA